MASSLAIDPKKPSNFSVKSLLVAFVKLTQLDLGPPTDIDSTNPLQMRHPDTLKFLHILLLVHTIQLQVRVPSFKS